MSQEKPTFKQIRQKHNITYDQLTVLSGIERATIYVMDLGMPIEKKAATIILKTLSEATGQEYTLENVNVPLRKTALHPIGPNHQHPFL